MSDAQKQLLADNLVAAMQGVPEEIQRRQVDHFRKADEDYGRRVAEGLGLETQAAAE
jgi:catalase